MSVTERGREIIYTDGEGGSFSYGKNMYTETNRLTDSQRYVYDAEGRIISNTAYSGKQTMVEYRDSEGITITTYSDGTQNIVERDKAGNIIRVTGGMGTIRYGYDTGGMLIEQNDEGAGEITRYAYNKAGQRSRMQSGNRDVQYYYGKNRELVYIRDTVQRLEVRYEYDNRERETRRIYGNGVRQETLYDRIGRIILIKETNSQNRLIRAEGYVYDEQGRRSYSVDGEGRVTKYIYNGKSQLAAVLYPWTAEKSNTDRKEAEESGLYFTVDKGLGQRHTYSVAEVAALRELLNRAFPGRGNAVAQGQMAWLETYTYDRNGNRAAKATPWGTIRYGYDAENRLLRKGDIVYTNDRNGNTLRERGLRYEAIYEYNGQNRMVYSEITSHIDRTHTVGSYAYDALGRRTLTESVTGQTLRTLYDGKGFEAVREGEAFRDGSLTTRFAAGSVAADGNGVMRSNQPTGERYRWLSDGSSGRIVGEDGYAVEGSRYGGRGVTLYGKGEAVAVNYSSGNGSRSTYLGKDILGSVRTATTDTGAVEDRYEYDAFGTVYQGDLSGGMNLGYTGKPYEMATGLYNYGYRDYKPQAARFTTVDPIRDGNNWFAYVNNDPVNYIDLWGLNDVRLTIFNFDPTPGLNEIVDQNGIAGHTWLGFDGLDYLGVGFYGDDSRPINQTSQVPLALLSDWDSNAPDNRQPTNDYTITITDAQAGMIKDYLNGMTDPNSSSYTPYYNLGGKYNEPNSTMCTEAVIDALNYAGVLNPLESYIVTDYKKWEESYPIPIPGVLEPRKNEFMNLTAPNPNAFEYRIKQLEATRDILNDFDYSSYVNRKKGQ